MSRLAPCPACGRHVKLDEHACPFCDHAFEGQLTATEGDWSRRVGRVGAIAVAAGLAAAAGCGDGGNPMPEYGAPAPMDGGTDDGGS